MLPVELKLNRKILILISLIVIIAAFLVSFYFYRKYKQLSVNLSNLAQIQQIEIKDIKSKVGRHYLLPEGEEPLLITVTDWEKVKSQPFFSRAQNGDKVLVYNNAKKAILYSPAKDLVLEVGPVIPATPTPTPPEATASAKSGTVSPTVKLENLRFILYNGTDIVGLTRTYETKLKQSVSTAEVVDRDDASKKDYPESLLVDLKGNKNAEAQKLAEKLNLTLSKLPDGETASPTADFLIILGADRK
ncbi:MAG: hypothetical protein UV73_C0017G0012 [Candidatus Gottesmanbacteria bacterium GW2011_GWA2_43_14]|uniref:LytR/CpsA/Psr regulator C-terminal domain-containing protein n=1 Tax=Candidatus Gottesmanbacteria bacterium GW2011_GWA2_43_14 TaxID=1618443 RepID=A0A0G1G959_9BACT|nr:MAG: hypothetical protein UV73_C0017G0012 [Candidatus Gottesmanbacteria bacterium GW2011_GWA2_43_14]